MTTLVKCNCYCETLVTITVTARARKNIYIIVNIWSPTRIRVLQWQWESEPTPPRGGLSQGVVESPGTVWKSRVQGDTTCLRQKGTNNNRIHPVKINHRIEPNRKWITAGREPGANAASPGPLNVSWPLYALEIKTYENKTKMVNCRHDYRCECCVTGRHQSQLTISIEYKIYIHMFRN